MQTTNPLPGMNPYLETSWPDTHVTLIGYIREALAEELPLDLRVRGEEDVEVGYEPPLTRYRPDVAIHEEPIVTPDFWRSPERATAVAEPEIIEVDALPHRWVEIRDSDSTLITVIEVVSPSNKEGRGRADYIEKMRDLLSAGVNLVEIDLVRSGQPVWSSDILRELKPADRTRYLIMVSRAKKPTQREVYYCPLQEALPTIRIPLRPTDPDATLELQSLIDRVYRTGRYWQVSHRELPAPALPPEDARWIEQRYSAAGLRT